ncbi:MAG: ATP-binding protein [Caldilineaceae bacterium]
MSSSLLERLEAARRQRFVGRVNERDLFQAALAAPDLPFSVLYLFGPGGVGKTTLLREFAYLAGQHQLRAVQLDARNIEAAPDFFLAALRRAFALPADEAVFAFLAAQKERLIILIDTVELLTPLDGWLREEFLPKLAGNTLVVMAARNPPGPAWRTDPGWQMMMCVLPVRNLSRQECRDFLVRRQIPSAQHETVLDFTHGHPLALSLVADVFAQRPGLNFQPEHTPDVIKILLERFIEKVPGQHYRTALEVCALVRLTTEALLQEVLQVEEASECFAWLRGLSFIDAERHGLFPHDLAREALAADLRWRNPEWNAELHARIRAYYLARMRRGGLEQRRLISDYMFLHRDNAVMRSYVEWQISGSVFADHMRPTDQPLLIEMVRRYEGDRSAEIAAYWIARQPERVSILRNATGLPQGFLLMLALDKVHEVDRAYDPAVQTVWRYLQEQAPLKQGETATLFRFWMAQDDYQAVSPIQSRLFLNMVQHYMTTPGLMYTFLPFADPDFWAIVCAYADLRRLTAADFVIDGRRYGVYGRDWRTLSPMTWLAAIAERELGGETKVVDAKPPEVFPEFSQADFANAVRDALRDFTNPNALQSNPLLKARLIVERCGPDSNAMIRIGMLKKVLQEAAAPLQASPRQASFFRVLHHTYFQPAATQEQAAELLDLPFSTYRRHLRSGIEFVTEYLWQREQGGVEK